jgi:hypothetical protein
MDTISPLPIVLSTTLNIWNVIRYIQLFSFATASNLAWGLILEATSCNAYTSFSLRIYYINFFLLLQLHVSVVIYHWHSLSNQYIASLWN